MILESGHKYLVGQKIVSLQYKNSEEEDQSKVPKDAPKKSAYVQQTLPIDHDDNMMKPVETTKLADGSGGIRVMPKGLIQVFRSEGNQKKAYLKYVRASTEATVLTYPLYDNPLPLLSIQGKIRKL
ncbi:unnamed protein product [Urochloa humidicola]